MPPSYADAHTPPSSPRSLRRPSRPLHEQEHPKSASRDETRDGLLQLAAMELEAMRRPPSKRGSGDSSSSGGSDNSAASCSSTTEEAERSFPPACQHLLHSLPGNSRCHDCDAPSAAWASVSYGITLCLQCSGRHRGLGVGCSFVKSLTLDAWKRREILCMLEGGNEQLRAFFDRHQMGGGEQNTNEHSGNASPGGSVVGFDRYKTKAASFYRQHLTIHARQLAEGGTYEGREASRRKSRCRAKQRKPSSGAGGVKAKCRNKSKEVLAPQLPTVTEKETSELACGALGA